MDYLEQAKIVRDASWEAFRVATHGRRLVLLSTKAEQPYWRHAFKPDDILLMGRETAGVPETVHAAADIRLVIPMRAGMRSLNVALACAMVTGRGAAPARCISRLRRD